MSFTVSSTQSESERWLAELPEPDPFSDQEFRAWRGLIRLRESAMREIDRRLCEEGDLTLSDYGLLITLVSSPGLRLRMSALGAQRMLTPSGITRVVKYLEGRGLVRREVDPADGRGSFAAMTRRGLEALRRAQVLHHAAVRDVYLGRLTPRELDRLGRLFEKALPGVVSAPVWPPTADPSFPGR